MGWEVTTPLLARGPAPHQPLLLHVTLQQQHNGWVAFGRLLELLQRDLVILILVHLLEDLVHTLLGCEPILVHAHHDHSAHHLVDSLDYLQHLEARDAPVAVQVVHLKGPVEFLLEAAAGGDRQGADELPEVDGAIAVLVKGAESVLREFGGIAVGKELDVELLELLQVQDAAGAVLQEALVPLLQLLLAELGVLNQVLQHLWGQLAVGLPHGRA